MSFFLFFNAALNTNQWKTTYNQHDIPFFGTHFICYVKTWFVCVCVCGGGCLSVFLKFYHSLFLNFWCRPGDNNGLWHDAKFNVLPICEAEFGCGLRRGESPTNHGICSDSSEIKLAFLQAPIALCTLTQTHIDVAVTEWRKTGI